ncbi:hypothetical protein [Kineococcus indalonis]|uniref:hypothetical protein n=1 Tax=Kineococcus indalonis TaxID=2696566 RepID=UPI001412B831|nr:hypothetical protein [Kineococcus indalonis]NAZ86934.1 hypothetical protein [Kineococcus indalonis]
MDDGTGDGADGTGGGIQLGLLGEEAQRRARRLVRLEAERCGLEERGDDAALVTAELLEGPEGGAVPTAVRVGEADGGLLVGVDLRGPRVLHLRELSEALVSGLSSSWGWEARPGGVHAWCHLSGAAAR